MPPTLRRRICRSTKKRPTSEIRAKKQRFLRRKKRRIAEISNQSFSLFLARDWGSGGGFAAAQKTEAYINVREDFCTARNAASPPISRQKTKKSAHLRARLTY